MRCWVLSLDCKSSLTTTCYLSHRSMLCPVSSPAKLSSIVFECRQWLPPVSVCVQETYYYFSRLDGLAAKDQVVTRSLWLLGVRRRRTVPVIIWIESRWILWRISYSALCGGRKFAQGVAKRLSRPMSSSPTGAGNVDSTSPPNSNSSPRSAI